MRLKHEQGDVEPGEDAEDRGHPVVQADQARTVLERGDLAREAAHADDADRALGVALAAAERRVGHADHVLREPEEDAGRCRRRRPRPGRGRP